MKRGLKVSLAGLLLLLAAIGVGQYLTRTGASLSPLRKQGVAAENGPVVQQKAWRTAKQLATEATTAGETQYATEAVRLADHEVDLAFTCALLENELQPAAASPAIQAAAQRIASREARVKQDEDEIAHATAQIQQDDNAYAQEALQLAQANLTLHQDELASAREDLQNAGGDLATRIAAERAWHEKTDQAMPAAHTHEPFAVAGTLAEQAHQWWTLHQRQRAIEQAKATAYAAAAALAATPTNANQSAPTSKTTGITKISPTRRKKTALSAQAKILAAMQAQARAAASTAQAKAQEATATLANGQASHADKLRALRDAASSRRLQTAYAVRSEDETQLAQVYAQWETALATERQQVLHAMLGWIGGIVAVWLTLTVGEATLERLRVRRGDRRRINSMKTMARVCSQVVAALIILLILFGPPHQLSTLIALTTAGLTVALKDFIVAFFGWFVLMGRNGLHVGDWVEIQGVGGEVLEIGILRTVLLETGNWSDAGHPTGRKVAFVNSFAIEGHYFNFTTTGQWLWDELEVVVPINADPLQVADQVQTIVGEGTRAEAAQAEEEWRHAARHEGTHTISAAPAISLRPTANGIMITVRYIATAGVRYKVRAQLYHDIVAMLHRQGLLQ